MEPVERGIGTATARYLLGRQLLESFGSAALSNLERLLAVVLGRLPLLLDGGAESLGAAAEVGRQVGAAGKAAAVLGNEVVERDLELGLLQVLIAAGASWLARDGFT
jgi:hypothetical protein